MSHYTRKKIRESSRVKSFWAGAGPPSECAREQNNCVTTSLIMRMASAAANDCKARGHHGWPVAAITDRGAAIAADDFDCLAARASGGGPSDDDFTIL